MSPLPGHFILTTERLTIRPFAHSDLDAYHAISNEGFGEAPLDERREWLNWCIANYTALARLYQPPYGDRAITLNATGELIGSVGFVPIISPFEKLPYFAQRLKAPTPSYFTAEFGLFWVVGAAYRRHGYATEAARAMIDFAFHELGLQRIVATTEYDNEHSIRVMRKLGMVIEHNPDPTPEWFQVVGILERE